MSIRWKYQENPNQNGGCLCHPANNPDQPGDGWGFVCTNTRVLDGPGNESPHLFRCEGCACDDPIADPRPAVIESTAVEIVEPKRKAAPRTS